MLDPQSIAIAVEAENAVGFSVPGSYKTRPIDYIDPAPKPFTVQIPLVEYFERVKRHKADKWQHDFCARLQSACEKRHIERTWAEYHAEAQLGKTSLLSQVFPAWCFGHDPLFRYILAMYNIRRSETHSSVVIQIMQSELHKDIFPDKSGHLPEVVSKEGWSTNARIALNDGQKSFSPVGLQSGITGSGFDWLTIDDPYKDPKEAFSETVYQNLATFWEFGIDPRLSPYSCIAAMFHRYSYDDFGGYLLNTGKFDYVRYAAIADGPYLHEETGQKFEDPLGRAVGEYISERRPASYYEDKKNNPKVWLSMFQGRPGRDEGDFFQVGKIEVVSDEFLADQTWSLCSLRARGWDHAATQGAGDNSAGGKVGFQPDGTVIIADVFSDQLDSAQRVAKQREIAEDDGADTTVVVPEGVSSDGKDVVFLMQQNLQGFNVVARKVTNTAPGSDAKKRRAYNFSVAVNSGKVKFLGGDWNERIKRLMRRFGNSTSGDDEIDALSDAYNYLYEEFHKGRVVKGLDAKNIITSEQFQTVFPHDDGFKVPIDWQIYAGVKITSDASRPNSAVIVAQSSVNADMDKALVVLDSYKEYTADFEPLFRWLDSGVKERCINTSSVIVWLDKDSQAFVPTIQSKIGVPVRVFDGGPMSGISELNWHIQPTQGVNKFNQNFASHLYAVDPSAVLQNEAAIWGYNDKGEPQPINGVLNCLRMVTYQFHTFAKPLTGEQRRDRSLPEKFQLTTLEKNKDKMTETEFSQTVITRQAKLALPKILNGSNKPKSRFAKFQR